jgi:hypothetical protein
MRLQQRWLNVAAAIAKTAPNVPPLACPSCGENDVRYQYVGDPATRVGYLNVWCTACLKGIRISRAKAPAGVEMLPFDVSPEVLRRLVPDFHEVG